MSRLLRSLRHSLAVAVLLYAVAASAADVQPAGRFGLGKPATREEIAGWDIDVRPDGAGLPRGHGTVAQGQEIYDAQCANCHGTFGESNSYLPIAGGVGTLGSDQPIRTTGSKLNYATTLFDYIRRAMPFNNPQTLSADEVYALTAYMLNLNDILPADVALDQDSLPKLKMPNRDGFTTAHGLGRRDGKPDTANVACMSRCAKDIRLSSEMPAYALGVHGDLAEQRRGIGAMGGLKTTAAAASAATSDAGIDLAKRLGCFACHGVDAALVGPGFRAIAGRYRADGSRSRVDDAELRLLAKLKTGGAGAWGPLPMPAQPQVSDVDGHAVIRWILDGAK